VHTNTANDAAAVGGSSSINAPLKKTKKAMIIDFEKRTLYPEKEQDHLVRKV
jgi:hypothetical protein